MATNRFSPVLIAEAVSWHMEAWGMDWGYGTWGALDHLDLSDSTGIYRNRLLNRLVGNIIGFTEVYYVEFLNQWFCR